MKLTSKIVFFLFSILLFYKANAQDPLRYKDDVARLAQKEYHFSGEKDLVVFAGSSSIRMWENVQDYFPDYHVINNGFGGSHFTDLYYFFNELILKHRPDYLFIYEGDNDIAGTKSPAKVMKDAKKLHRRIQKELPETRVVFISPKPSIKRVQLKEKYENFNSRLEKYCKRHNAGFADVWEGMSDEKGNVFQDIFLEDDLHMNKKGYDIWAKVISGHLN